MDKKLSDLTTGDIERWFFGLRIELCIIVGIVVLLAVLSGR